jgi:hypothetical protein
MDSNSIGINREKASTTPEVLAGVKNDVAALHQELEVIKDATQSNRAWDILKIVLPVLLTTILGFLIWYTQTKIQHKVEENSRLLSTRLALTEEFYRHKLKTYEDTCAEIARLRESLERYGDKEVDPEVGAQATDSMAAVDRLSKSEFLYLSDTFKTRLSDLWQIGRIRMETNEEGELRKQLADQIELLRLEMNSDLHTKELSLPTQTPHF